MRIAVYTVITGLSDNLKFIEEKEFLKEADFYLISSQVSTNHQYKTIWARVQGGEERLISRKYKFLCHKYLPDYDFHIYMDGTFKLNESPRRLIEKYMPYHNLALFKHPYRNTLKEEVEYCIAQGKFKEEDIAGLLAEISRSGYPEDYLLTENGVLIRKNKPKIREFNNYCWGKFRQYPFRDQAFFSYAL